MRPNSGEAAVVGGDCLLESAPLAEGELLGGNSLVVTSVTLIGHVCLLSLVGECFGRN